MSEPVKLPYSLYRTYHALESIGGEATASEVAERIGFQRAPESVKLNTLALLKVVKREQVGKTVVFTIVNPAEIDFSVPKRVRK